MAGMTTDPFGDMLARIKNANQRKHKNVSIPFSKEKQTTLSLLKQEGFVGNFMIEKQGIKKNLIVDLKYSGDQRVIVGVKRISKPGLRVYVKASDLPRVLSGYGTAIISTSQGVMTDRAARKAKIGGEVLAYVW